jgi:transposase
LATLFSLAGDFGFASLRRGGRPSIHARESKMETLWVGIDVSKGRLDAALFSDGKARERPFANDPRGRASLLAWARREAGAAPVALCVESTGPYHLPLARLALEGGLRVAVENPRRVLCYGRALGLVGKTDPADARLLARYAQAREPRPWAPPSKELARLAALDRRLVELDGLLGQEGNRLEDETLDAWARESVERVLGFLREEKARVLSLLESHAVAHEGLAADLALLQSVPGVGPRAAVAFLAQTAGKEFESGEQVAAYAGACPRRSQSGKKEGPTRISRQGNAALRSRFYLPAVVAKRCNPLVRELYERLVGRGMAKKAAVLACVRRLLMVCHAVLRDRRPYDPDHPRRNNA